MASVSVSLEGDSRYRDALNAVARSKNKHVGKMVREALDEKFGGEISKALSFFAADADQNQQIQISVTNSPQHQDKPRRRQALKAGRNDR